MENQKQEYRKLTDFEEYVIVRKGTERPFSGEYETNFNKGTYVCKRCGAELYRSTDKFDARCGWPSFDAAIDNGKIKEILDKSFGMIRREVVCNNCGSHLGHVFDDGPEPTKLRYCMDSAAMKFIPKEDLEKEGYGSLSYLFK